MCNVLGANPIASYCIYIAFAWHGMAPTTEVAIIIIIIIIRAFKFGVNGLKHKRIIVFKVHTSAYW